MTESVLSGMEFIDVVASLDGDHVGTVEIQRRRTTSSIRR